MNDKLFLNGITIEELANALMMLINLNGESNNHKSEAEFVTRDEACKLLSINKTSLWKHTKSGRLKSYGMGNRVYYKTSELLESIKPLNH